MLWWRLGSPLCAGAPHMSQQLHRGAWGGIWGKQGKGRELEEAYSLLFCPLPLSPLWAAVKEKISYWLIGYPRVKQLPRLQDLNGENHLSYSWLQGQSALFVPWMLKPERTLGPLQSSRSCCSEGEQWRWASLYYSYQTSDQHRPS